MWSKSGIKTLKVSLQHKTQVVSRAQAVTVANNFISEVFVKVDFGSWRSNSKALSSPSV